MGQFEPHPALAQQKCWGPGSVLEMQDLERTEMTSEQPELVSEALDVNSGLAAWQLCHPNECLSLAGFSLLSRRAWHALPVRSPGGWLKAQQQTAWDTGACCSSQPCLVAHIFVKPTLPAEWLPVLWVTPILVLVKRCYGHRNSQMRKQAQRGW